MTSLDRYQELLQLPLAAFNGLNKPRDINRYACTDIWTETERTNVSMYLTLAQEMREKELAYKLSVTYHEAERYQHMGSTLVLDGKYVIAIGKQITEILDSLTITYPAVEDQITVAYPTTVVNTSELHFYKPGTDREVTPKSIIIAGGVATVVLYRARLVKPELLDDREDKLDYDDNANYLTSLTVKRTYMDVAQGVQLVHKPFTDEDFSVAVPFISDCKLGIVHIHPAVYTAGVPTLIHSSQSYSSVKISYTSGRVDQSLDLGTIRLAHTLMPFTPNACESIQQYWQKDHETPDNAYWTPYGNSNGAMAIWMQDSRLKVGQGGKF